MLENNIDIKIVKEKINNMKMMTFLNVSNRNNMTADSAYIFYNILSPYFTISNTLIFVAPVPLDDPKCIFEKMEFGFDKYQVRFSFDWIKVQKIIMKHKPDVLILNQVELVPAYKALLISIGINIPIVTYVHYIPYVLREERIVVDSSLNNNNIGKSIVANFFSGLVASDLIFTHSNMSRNMILKLLKTYNADFDVNKIIINPPPVDPYLIDENENAVNKIFYNHRLYGHYGVDRFIEAAECVSERYNLEINVLDVLGNRSPDQNRMDNSVEEARDKLSKIENVRLVNDTYIRARYRDEIKNSLFSIAPYRENCIWAMACIDSMSLGVPVIAPNIAWYREVIPSDLLFNNIHEEINIIEKLLYDKKFWLIKRNESIEVTKKYYVEKVAQTFLVCFTQLVDG